MTAKPFTGRRATVILIAFFGVVVAVNLLMATLATRTFGGKVVENSYVASQHYNRWLADARRQQALGWTIVPSLDAQRRVMLSASVANAEASGFARHPLGREADVPLRFRRAGDKLVADRPLPVGRWAVHLLVRSGGNEARLIETLS